MKTSLTPAFYPLVAACKAHGIGRNTAYKLADSGAIKSFEIGDKRYVWIDSLREFGLKQMQQG